MALAAGDRATRLVQQLLTLARLDHDAGARRSVPVVLSALVKSAFELVAEEAAANHVGLACEGADEALTVAGDADLLLILLRNLLDNAVRYSSPQGNVTVGLARDGNSIVLTVDDEGPGIAPEKRSEALQRFRRLDAGGRQGSGLGLSIAARIAELHAAGLTLRDGRNGRGLCVEIRFPCAPAD
jgi:two-component system sensor histidine kinase QseC